MTPNESLIDELIGNFCLRFGDIIKYLETCEIDSADGSVDILPIVYNQAESYRVSFIYSRGINWHTDKQYAKQGGIQYCSMFVLSNPGYIFKRRLQTGQIEAHEKVFFSFDITKRHGLFWNRKRLSKNKRHNWVGLSIDSYKVLSEAKCHEIICSTISMSVDDFICKRWLNRVLIGQEAVS
jgi:hypothetical protein